MLGQPVLHVGYLFSSELAWAGFLVAQQHPLQKQKHARLLKAFTKSWNTFPSAGVPQPAQSQGWEIDSSALDGKFCKVTEQRAWIWEGQ